ncbi:hypothetical protein DIC82_13740 [Clostridium beijerinckii]|nr:hypothetical protein DIC82_13740 [Clostridium beijerinckii]
MIENIDDLVKNINNEDNIILTPKNYEFTSPLIIGNTSKIIGNGCKLIGPILICNDVTIINVTFLSLEHIINIRCGSKVKFIACTFIGNDRNIAISLESQSNSSISLIDCKFSNFVTALSINENNSLNLLKNCLFQFCTVAIDNIVAGSFVNTPAIKDNLMFNSKEHIFLKFDKSFSTDDYYNFSFELCINNNYTRIFGKNNSLIFDTISFHVKNLKELNYILDTHSNCTTIFLDDGVYNLENNTENFGILINHPVNLIGINSPTFIKTKENSIDYAITINSPNVRIENLKIDGSERYLLRDGIHFEENGGANVKIKNVEISRISRRGISLFGKKTSNCLVENCKFSYIKEQSAIYVFKDIYIYNCYFQNLKIAIDCTADGTVNFQNNVFENIYCCLLVENPSFNKINQANNRYNFVENLVMLRNT